MKSKASFYFAMVIALFTVSCGGKDEPVNLKKNVYKIEVSTTENSMYYWESVVMQINDDKASSVNIKNAPDLTVELESQYAKTFKSMKKGQALSIFETSQPVSGITLSLGYLFDDDATSGEDEYPFTCTVKVYKDNKLIETKNQNITITSYETITLNYHNQ